MIIMVYEMWKLNKEVLIQRDSHLKIIKNLNISLNLTFNKNKKIEHFYNDSF